MKKVLLLLTVALLVPGLLSAQTMGVYFNENPGQMAYSPTTKVFEAQLYIHAADYYVTAVEYMLLTPHDLTHTLMWLTGVAYPDNMSVEWGDPFSTTVGHNVSYWPPLNGFVPGYNLMATYTFYIPGLPEQPPCYNMVDFPIVVAANPDSGELRGTYHPDMLPFPIIGLTSILCPDVNAVEEESWGAIKSLFK